MPRRTAVALILMKLYPESLLMVSLYGLLENLLRLLAGSAVGRFCDRCAASGCVLPRTPPGGGSCMAAQSVRTPVRWWQLAGAARRRRTLSTGGSAVPAIEQPSSPGKQFGVPRRTERLPGGSLMYICQNWLIVVSAAAGALVVCQEHLHIDLPPQVRGVAWVPPSSAAGAPACVPRQQAAGQA